MTLLYHAFVNKSRRKPCISSATCCGISSMRSIVYHQFRRNCISSTRSVASHQVAERYTLMRDDIQPKGLMISTTLRAAMIYQVCDLDKKILQKMYPFLQYFLVRETGLEPVHQRYTPLKRARLPIPPLPRGTFDIIHERNQKVKRFCKKYFVFFENRFFPQKRAAAHYEFGGFCFLPMIISIPHLR